MTIVSSVRINSVREQIKKFLEKAGIRHNCHKKVLRDIDECRILGMRAKRMNEEDYDTCELTYEEYQMLRIIEKETGIPIEVQVMQALAMWQTKNSPKRTNKP